jgi:aerobic carbon-monoxide dehydrogenase large subunit
VSGQPPTAAKLVGSSVQRVEDSAFLTGGGRYTDDLKLPLTLSAAFHRSPVPHARIIAMDTNAAQRVPGVTAVLTHVELAGVLKPLKQRMSPPGYKSVAWTALASDKLRFVGDPIAMVLAEDRYIAEDAAELVSVEYEVLKPVVDKAQALEAGSSFVFEEFGDNLIYSRQDLYGDIDAAFENADRIIRETFTSHRHTMSPMEGRAGVASYDATSGLLTCWAATQSPHLYRMTLAHLLDHPVEKLRVIAPDFGGSFGQKGFYQREEIAIVAATRLLGRPVKWIEDRVENLSSSGHARDEALSIEAAVRQDGALLGVKVDFLRDAGAYPVLPFPVTVLTDTVRVLFPNCYKMPAMQWNTRVAVTNKASYVAYRSPSAVETWVRERMWDVIATELGLDKISVRDKNLWRKEDLPASMLTGPDLVGMNSVDVQRSALDIFDLASFRRKQTAARKDQRYLGFGISTFMEAAKGPRNYALALGATEAQMLARERVRLTMGIGGGVTVHVGQAPHGQSHRTSLAQVVADELGIAFEQVTVVTGDTSTTPYSMMGTAGSHFTPFVLGSATVAAAELRQKIKSLAGEMLEADPDDLDIARGVISVKGTQQMTTCEEIALAVFVAPERFGELDSDLRAESNYDGGHGGWTFATHCCTVEVDTDTGIVGVTRYVVAHDCGQVINPAIVRGQISGGVAQGIGAVLLEHCSYDDTGQFLSTTWNEYLLPRTTDVPRIEVHHIDAADEPSYFNSRGVGEGGMLGAPAAISSAIEDALSPFGVRVTEKYLPPARIIEILDGRSPSLLSDASSYPAPNTNDVMREA